MDKEYLVKLSGELESRCRRLESQLGDERLLNKSNTGNSSSVQHSDRSGFSAHPQQQQQQQQQYLLHNYEDRLQRELSALRERNEAELEMLRRTSQVKG
jgi:RNA polymerase-interacting CarD/CdnL/TRCF family regulator